MGEERGDSENVQWAQIVRFGEGYADVPTGEGPVTHPASGQVDQLADVMSYDAELVAGGADHG
ncbi:MAG TPA: hypothetical protein VFW69_08735 [Mycobacterium sp.]|nr:hypothetical protein [Mycobacterium sp.]